MNAVRISNSLGKSRKGSTTGEKLFTFNSKVIFIGLTLLSLGIVSQMFRWQVLNKDYYTALAQSQYVDSQKQASSRGIIYAADGTILATDEPAWDIYASLSSIEAEREDFFAQKDKYVATVAGTLALEKDAVNKMLTDDFRYVPLKYNVSTDAKKELEETEIFEDRPSGFGFYFIKSEKRIYPNGTLASQAIGFMGRNDEGQDVGLYGIEGYYSGDITGSEGFTYEEKDAYGNVILTSEYDPVLPRKGKDITLTIVPALQSKIEDSLKKGVTQHQAKSGSAILMDPRTGAILAMANYPTYDPNEYWRTQDSWIFKNKAIADVYEPGSIFKPITVAIGLETGVITPESECNDSTGYFTIYEGTQDEAKIYTWDRKPDGILHPEQFLQYSNNPCIAQTALDVGHERYYPKMKGFGIGDFIGVGLQDETNSYLKPYEDWIELDLAVTAFGQSVSATPLQMISALSTLANDGKRMEPHIVSQISDDEEIIDYNPRVLSQPISKETANLVANMMRSVVRKGDASYFFNKYLPDYDVGGKTGTAQIPKENEVGYYEERTNTTFVGFAPIEKPEMIMLVRLEEPGLESLSSTTVVPVWVDMFMEIAEDLELPKQVVPN